MIEVKESRAERDTRLERDKCQAFDKWLNKPETKLLLSFIPGADQPEAMATLLRMAFNAGHDSGAGAFIGDIVEAMLKAPRKEG